MGRILTIARNDAKRILEMGGFETSITLIKDVSIITINGLGLVHHLTFDTEGQPVNSRNAHISVCEASLTDEKFPVRNYDGEVALRNAVVRFKDSTNIEKSYIVKENFADESLGTITLVLGAYAE